MATGDQVEAASRILPILEAADLDDSAASAGYINHPRIRIDAQRGDASPEEVDGDLAGPAAHVESRADARGQEVVEQSRRIAGPEPVIGLGARPERHGTVAIGVQMLQRHASSVAQSCVSGAPHISKERIAATCFIDGRTGAAQALVRFPRSSLAYAAAHALSCGSLMGCAARA